MTIQRIATACFIVIGLLLNNVYSYASEPGIQGYRPSMFTEQSEAPFFYSIGKHLKYGKNIDGEAPAIFKGKFFNGDITKVFPSPDNRKAVIVSGGSLYLVQIGKQVEFLLDKIRPTVSFRNDNIGDEFYISNRIQWSQDSRLIYITKVKIQKSPPKQNHSRHFSLKRINIENPLHIDELVSDFGGWKYFMVGNDAICFSYAPGNGSVIYKCSTPAGVSNVVSINDKHILLENGVRVTGTRFVSYAPDINETEIWLTRHGFFIRDITSRVEGFFSRSRPSSPIFTINTAIDSLKGHRYDGIWRYGSSVLPGGRYILLKVSHDEFEGELLVDSSTGQYRELPENTRVYQNINSSNYGNFTFCTKWKPQGCNKFLPISRLRVKNGTDNP